MATKDKQHELSEARARVILENARDAVISIDGKGTITHFNKAAETMFEYESATVIGRNVNTIMPEPYRSQHDDYIKDYRATRVPKAIGRIRDVHGLRSGGEVFPMELSVAEVVSGPEPIYTAIIRDVSEQRRAAQELARANEFATQRERLADIGAIAAKLVHDIGNPLSGLSMRIDHLRHRIEEPQGVSPEKLRESLTHMHEAAASMRGLIRGFMDFAREQSLQRSETDLLSLLGRVIDSWTPVASQAGTTISLHAKTTPPSLKVDTEKLQRVFHNLIRNAVEAVADGHGTRVDVTVESTPTSVIVAVCDDGLGVAAGIDVFQLFETTKPDGTGIGLAVAKQIVAAHGGRITHDRTSGGGAEFRVEIPLSSELEGPKA